MRLLATALAAAPFLLHAQKTQKLRRIGWLYLGKAWDLAGFRRALVELGWIEGQNIAIEGRFADNDERQLPVLAADLVARNGDVIVTQTTSAAVAAKQATATIPIVMAGSQDPVELGLVASLARPGANVTGVTHVPGPEFPIKVVQLLKEAAPAVSRLAVLHRAAERDAVKLEAAARTLGITVVDAEANTHGEVPAALERALRAGANGLFAPPNPVNDAQRHWIVDFAIANRWPTIGGDRNFVAAGGLMSYWADWTMLRRQAAVYVDKILRGAKPGDLPIEQPSRLQLLINLRTAKALRLTIAQSLRLRADELMR